MGKPPPYAILSHRWGTKEVTFEEMKSGRARESQGMSKVTSSCKVAARYGLKHMWIDTCCIDKTSSAELSEAINSMFRYYREAEICYPFLLDVVSVLLPIPVDPLSDFCRSTWFRRGWMLQELIAPKEIRFYNKYWEYIGSETGLKDALNSVTNIPEICLLGGDLTDESLARIMS